MEVPDLIPARMLAEYAYCPRLGYLMWVENEFADNVFTVDGRRVHQRVDGEAQELPEGDEAAEQQEMFHARSVMLSSPEEGLIAKIDLVELDGPRATPIDYKRGKKPAVPEGAYEPERVQLCAQGLILRANGYTSEAGVVYYAGSKERVEVPFSAELLDRTRSLAREYRETAQKPERPPPLDDSPKCRGCSLAGICLPDETVMLTESEAATKDGLRRLHPARDDALPLYVQAHGLQVGKSGDVLVVKERGSPVAEAKFVATSQVCLFGNVGITPQALHECCQRSIPVCHFGAGAWFYGITTAVGPRNAEAKRVQFRAADDARICLSISQRIVEAKIRNQRTLLRRNAGEVEPEALRELSELADAAGQAGSLESLLGIEGRAARVYFASLPRMLKPREGSDLAFDFEGRNRRPPRDPVNAMLSFAYAMLAKDCTVALLAVGMDPHLGFFHQPRFGRPALALDLMEEYRPLVADSVVLTLVNNAMVAPRQFIKVGKSVAMRPEARRALIQAYERRMDQLVTHPVFGYRLSYRRTLEVQARLLLRHLAGEIGQFPAFTPR
jgi:CRISPR-associated protein Cas1